MGVLGVLKGVAVSTCLEYDTPKTVHIRSRFVGILNRVIQLAIISYVIGYIFILHKGYQYFDTGAVSGTTTKLKGVAYTTVANDERVGEKLWDATDLIVPPEENGAFFVTTNIITTRNQTQGECTENAWGTDCTDDTDCNPEGTRLHLAHGVSTGRCNTTSKHCMVKAWCPIEDDTLPVNKTYAVLNDTKNWTVMIKNHVYFPYYKKARSNLIESVDLTYIRKCNYHHVHHKYCPIFRLQDIVSLAETSASGNEEYDEKWFQQMAIKGGVVSIQIKWDCNFDKKERECKPQYSFARLDNFKGNSISTGYNFRYPIYYYEDGIQKRNLVKTYGILFILEIEATARAFDIVTFSQNLGSGFALLGMAVIFSDICLLYCHRKKSFFKKHIYLDLTEEENASKGTSAAPTRSNTEITSSNLEVETGLSNGRNCNDATHELL